MADRNLSLSSECLQVDIVNLLQLEKRQVTVVGDDHQAIYGFRGSMPTVFRDFTNDYDHPSLLQTLTVNYRHADSGNIC